MINIDKYKLQVNQSGHITTALNINKNNYTDLSLFGFKLNDLDKYDSNIIIIISLINMLGVDFYLELKKQGYIFTDEIEDIIKVKIRDSKIDSVINK